MRRHASVFPDAVVFFILFVEPNISGTAERICAKFTEKTSFVPRSDEFECHCQRSKVKVTRDKNALCTSITLPGSDEMVRFRCIITHQQTAPFRRCLAGVILAACERFVFGKTSLGLVLRFVS